ncbi:unnamed protein product [Rotaria sp. Silwood1]|nr:unnamed protein product [Rotaria sp. Silwood1]
MSSTTDEIYTKIFEQLLLINKHQIYSLHLWILQNEHFFSSFPIDSSLDHLESLALTRIKLTTLSSLLSNLTYLPRLFSLTIDAWRTLKDLSDVYRLIFTLPKLKYIKCIAEDLKRSISLPFALKNQTSTIEHLVIDHSCTFKELSTILSYTPQLRHLYFSHLNDSYPIIQITILPMILSNLSLKVLYYTTRSQDVTFLETNRWEQLFQRYFPRLEKFHFQYYRPLDFEYISPIYPEDPNPFISSFWIERKWILEAEMRSFEVVYSIRPYKKRWYDDNSSSEIFKSTRFTVTCLPRKEELEILMMNISSILTLTQIYHLEIPERQICSSSLINIINVLSKLDSFKIHSLSLSSTRNSSVEEIALRNVSIKNKITKVCLEKMIEIEEIYYLMKLCPRMNYLQVDYINNINIELFVQDILQKVQNEHNQYLRSLCFMVPTIENEMVKKLEEMIHSQKSFLHYMIKRHYTINRVVNSIYLEWK